METGFFLFLQIFWFFAIGAVLIIYACTAGFDFGTTIMVPFMRKEDDRRVMLNVVGPTWDGNQTWLVFGGGAIFVIWPMVYASVFSGLYAAMMLILWSFFLRPPGFEYRHKIHSQKWRTMWDWGLFISAFFPILLFGVLFGNLLHGLPIFFDPVTFRPYYNGNFFGLLNLPGVLCGVVAVLMILMHGAALQHRRTEGAIKARMAKLHTIFSWLLLILFTVMGFLVAFVITGYHLVSSPAHPTYNILNSVVTHSRGGWITTYAQYPWKIAAPIVAYAAMFLAMLTKKVGRGALTFWFSCLSVAGIVATAGVTLFPFVVPSSYKPAQSITAWNGTSAYYTLGAMFFVALVLLTIVLIYKMMVFHGVWRKKQTLNIDDVNKEDGMSY